MKVLMYDNDSKFINLDFIECARTIKLFASKYYIKLIMHSSEALYIGPFDSQDKFKKFMHKLVSILETTSNQYFTLNSITNDLGEEYRDVGIHRNMEQARYVK